MLDKLLRQILLLIEPIGFVWLCLLILTVSLWRRRQRRLAAGAFLVSVVIFIDRAARKFPGLVLLGSLERPYAGVNFEELPPGGCARRARRRRRAFTLRSRAGSTSRGPVIA